jgi:hypothetical protein
MVKKAAAKPKRKALPAETERAVLTEAGFMCANPRCRHMLTLEIHHIIEVRERGGNEAYNLLALCPNCHSAFTRGRIPRSAIETWKQMLLVVNHGLDRESLDLLLFLHRQEGPARAEEAEWEKWHALETAAIQRWQARNPGSDPPHRSYSSGHAFYNSEEYRSLPRMPSRDAGAAIIDVSGDGLLRLARLIMAGLVDEGPADYSGTTMTQHWTPRLTDTGMAIADAWLSGDAQALRAVLRGLGEPGVTREA